jgi:hypothetical protein
LNAKGQIVGSYADSAGVFHSFLAVKDTDPDSGLGAALPLGEGQAGVLNPDVLHQGAPDQKSVVPPCTVRQPLRPDPNSHMTACAAQ